MTKWRKKYGKARWIDTRLSKPYKMRRALSFAETGVTLAQAAAAMRQIAQAQGDKLGKSMALASLAIRSNKAVSERLKSVKGRKTEVSND